MARAVAIGALRHPVTIEAENPTPDGGGGQGDPWASPLVVATARAAIEPLSGGEALRAQQLEARLTHKVTMRYRAGITAAMRVRFGARVFNIRRVRDLQERTRFLELLCEEGVAT